MKSRFFSEIKNIIENVKKDYKAYSKINESARLSRIVKKVSVFGENTEFYNFMLESISKIELNTIKNDIDGITILDEKNNKSLEIKLYPNVTNYDNIVIEYKENDNIFKKELKETEIELILKTFEKKDNIQIKTERTYIDNELVKEEASRMKIADRDNYSWVVSTTEVDENNTALRKDFYQIRTDGFIVAQYFKYFRGHILPFPGKKFCSSNPNNIKFLYKYLNDKQYEISCNKYEYHHKKDIEKDTTLRLYK